jgi:hypothetical protein
MATKAMTSELFTGIDASIDETSGALVVKMSTKKSWGDSKSGKSVNFASTGGNHRFSVNGKEFQLGINLYAVKPKAKKK